MAVRVRPSPGGSQENGQQSEQTPLPLAAPQEDPVTARVQELAARLQVHPQVCLPLELLFFSV